MRYMLLAALVCVLMTGCNVWHVSPAGNDTNPGTASQPVRSFQRCHNLAAPGDVCSVHQGVYPIQALADSTKQVAFVADGQVTVKATSPGTDKATLEVRAQNVTFDGIDVDSGNFLRQGLAIHNGEVVFKNARVGNVTDEKGALVSGDDIVLDNVDWHDVWLRTEGVHNECVYAIVTERIRVTNSTFTNCATMDVMFTYGDWWTPLPPDWGNGTVEGNTFGCPRFENGAGCHYFGLLFNGVAGWSVHGWTVRNNSFPNTTTPGSNDIGLDKPYQNGVRCGNTGPSLGAEWKVPC